MKKFLAFVFCCNLSLHGATFGMDDNRESLFMTPEDSASFIIEAFKDIATKHNDVTKILYELSIAPYTEQPTINLFTGHVNNLQRILKLQIHTLKRQLEKLAHEIQMYIIMSIAQNEITQPEVLFEKIFNERYKHYLNYYYLWRGEHLKKSLKKPLILDEIITECRKTIAKMNKAALEQKLNNSFDLFYHHTYTEAFINASQELSMIINRIDNKDHQILLLGNLLDWLRPEARIFIASYFPPDVQRYFILNWAA